MHVHFIFPRWKKLLEDCPELRDTLSGRQIGSFCMAGLGIPTAASALPPEHTVTMTDEHVEPVNDAVQADLIALSFFTPQASNAYAIADRFRDAGRRVIAGGIHPSLNPDETLLHADAVITGPAEGVWEQVMADLRGGALKPRYHGTPNASFARPRRELFRASSYLRAGIVQTARGCSVNCRFCVVPRCNGSSVIYKPVDAVIEDIRAMPFPCFYFADENLLFADAVNSAYRNELLNRLTEARLCKVFFLAAYPFMLRGLTPEDIQRLSAAGCRQIYLVLGLFDPLCRELADESLANVMRRLQEAGIETMATFTLGHEEDAPERVEDTVLSFSARAGVNLAEFTITTPFPGTPVFARLDADRRILTKNWALYNGAHVVFRPLRESPDALRQRFMHLWHAFYKDIDFFGINQRYARGFGSGIFDHE